MKLLLIVFFFFAGFSASAQQSDKAVVNQKITIKLVKVALVEKAETAAGTLPTTTSEVYNVTSFDTWIKKEEKPVVDKTYVKDSEVASDECFRPLSAVVTLSPV